MKQYKETCISVSIKPVNKDVKAISQYFLSSMTDFFSKSVQDRIEAFEPDILEESDDVGNTDNALWVVGFYVFNDTIDDQALKQRIQEVFADGKYAVPLQVDISKEYQVIECSTLFF